LQPLQPEINFNKAVTFVRSAASQGAELAVLPEYHLTGWKPEDPRFLAVCESCEGWVEKYQELAKELGICTFSLKKGEVMGKIVKQV
jgi:predicted amidohydrolase